MDTIEDYPGQRRDYERFKAIDHAVEEADRIILDASDGSVQEADYLTAKVAERFMQKVVGRVSAELMKHDVMARLRGIDGRAAES